MAKKLSTVWAFDPHTAAKHEILRRYLEAWMPILSSAHSRIVYADACAGPGEYAGGEPGSPIIALDAARKLAERRSLEMTFLFIEKERARAEHLQRKIDQLGLPASFTVQVRCGTAVDEINTLLDDLAAARLALAPTFVFLDPFGVSQTPMSLVARLMANSRCEVLITFMYEEINRFLGQPEFRDHLDALFGGAAWKPALGMAPGKGRRDFLRETYRRQLMAGAGIGFVRSFEMLNKNDATDYFMFFGTNKALGLEKMKEAMWKVDPSGTFQFSDATDPTQLMLLGGGPDAARLESLLRERFAGQPVPVEAIEAFVIEETPFCATQYKRVLRAMEMATPPRLRIVSTGVGPRVRGRYPEGRGIVLALDSGATTDHLFVLTGRRAWR